MTTTIDTRAGEVWVMLGQARQITSDGATYYDVGVTIGIGERSLAGEVSIGDDGHAIGPDRGAWVSRNILDLLETEVPEDEHRAVLDAIEHMTGRLVVEFVEVQS